MTTVRATFVPVHGGGDGAWNWTFVEAELRALGHDVVLIDLPADDESAGLADYAEHVVRSIGDRPNIVLVAHSLGAFSAPLVCERRPIEALVLLAGLIPAPGEAPSDWWSNTGHGAAQREARRADGLADDEMTTYYHDVPPEIAAEAQRHARNHPSDRAYSEPWPLERWPDVRTHALVCRDDRLLPAAWLRGVVRDRLGIDADEIDGGHCVNLSRPADLARRLAAFAD